MVLFCLRMMIKNKLNFGIVISIFIIIFLVAYTRNYTNISNQEKEISINIIQNNQIQNNLIPDNFNKNVISVPVDVYIVKYTDESLSSSRDEENILEVFDNVNILWKQAGIKVNIRKIKIVVVKDSTNYYDLNKLLLYMSQFGYYNQSRINAYFAQTLHGSNGIAFPGNRIMVADRTSVYDFRATSHEIGHVLSLIHVGPISRLMARGVNGFELIEEEIDTARENALVLFS